MHYYRISLSLLLCLSFSGLSGQINVMGKVNQPLDTVVTLIVPPTSLGEQPRKVSAPLSAANKFSFAIRTSIATPAEIVHGGSSIPIFILPDHSFSVEFTAGDEETTGLLFTGPGGANNTFLHQYIEFLEAEAPTIDSIQLAQSTTKEFRRLMDQNRAAKEGFLKAQSETAGTNVSPQMLQWLRNDIEYGYADELLRYPSVFRSLHNGTKSRNPTTDYYAFLQGMAINNPDAILQHSYQQFLESFILHKLEKPMHWKLRTADKNHYAFLNRFLYDLPLHFMQCLVLERTALKWLVDKRYLAQEYQSFMASKAPESLKQHLKKLRDKPPKVYSIKSFSIIGGPVLWEVFQFHDGNRPDTSHFKGQPSLLYFHARHVSRVGFAIRYLKKLRRKLEPNRAMNICLVDVNTNFEEWQRIYASSGYADHPITHVSMNSFDELFDRKIPQGRKPNIVVANADGIIVNTMYWKPPVKRILRIINRLP